MTKNTAKRSPKKKPLIHKKHHKKHIHNVLWFLLSLVILAIALVAINNLFNADSYIDEWNPQKTCPTTLCVAQETTRAYPGDVVRAQLVLPSGTKQNVYSISYEQLAYFADGTRITQVKPYLHNLPTIASETQNFAIIVPDDSLQGRYVFTLNLVDQHNNTYQEIVSVTVI